MVINILISYVATNFWTLKIIDGFSWWERGYTMCIRWNSVWYLIWNMQVAWRSCKIKIISRSVNLNECSNLWQKSDDLDQASDRIKYDVHRIHFAPFLIPIELLFLRCLCFQYNVIENSWTPFHEFFFSIKQHHEQYVGWASFLRKKKRIAKKKKSFYLFIGL